MNTAASPWKFLAGALLWAGTAACSSQIELPSQSSGAGGQDAASGAGGQSSSVATSGAGGGATGGGGAPVIGAPEGHYMMPFIGDCINGEEWLTFGSDSSFTHTFVDRNFCGPHSVTATPGSLASDGHELEITWATPMSSELRRHTFAIVDPFSSISSWPPVDGYEIGTASLNIAAYFRAGDAPLWHRDDRQRTQSKDGVYDVSSAVDLSLDAPLAPPAGPTECSMKVSISVSVITSDVGPPAVGAETFSFACTYAPDGANGWIRLTADGFEGSATDGSWMAFFEQNGIWKKYPSSVSQALYDAFLPVLFYVPSDDTRLFHDRWFTWYQEMKSPPPSSVD